jgi:hypothetical protein
MNSGFSSFEESWVCLCFQNRVSIRLLSSPRWAVLGFVFPLWVTVRFPSCLTLAATVHQQSHLSQRSWAPPPRRGGNLWRDLNKHRTKFTIFFYLNRTRVPHCPVELIWSNGPNICWCHQNDIFSFGPETILVPLHWITDTDLRLNFNSADCSVVSDTLLNLLFNLKHIAAHDDL